MTLETETPNVTVIPSETMPLVEMTISAHLRQADYDYFVPRLEALIAERGPLRLLVRLEDFDGWSAGALWEDTRYGTRRFDDVVGIAVVGQRRWQRNRTHFCRPFTEARARFFADVEAARDWLDHDDD